MKPGFNEPLYNEVLGIANDILQTDLLKCLEQLLDITNQVPTPLGLPKTRGLTEFSWSRSNNPLFIDFCFCSVRCWHSYYGRWKQFVEYGGLMEMLRHVTGLEGLGPTSQRALYIHVTPPKIIIMLYPSYLSPMLIH